LNRFRNILFDLDGTLTDSKEGIVNAILHAVRRMNLLEHNPEELVSFIGPPLKGSFIQRYRLSEAEAKEALALYREYYSVQGKYENKIYPGIRELLRVLNDMGQMLFIATSKPTLYSRQIAEHFSIDIYFRDIVGSHMDHTRTGKPEIIRHILEEYQLGAPETIMIGDRGNDLAGARECGVKSVAVSYGFGDPEEFTGLGALFIASDVDELKSKLLELIR
jgi:phosphoglycolate phosphatase